METIWKYQMQVTDIQTLFVPENAKPLCVQIQHEIICIWMKVDTPSISPDKEMTIFVHGTGHQVLSQTAKYLGTFQIKGGTLVFHVFWEWAKRDQHV